MEKMQKKKNQSMKCGIKNKYLWILLMQMVVG